MQILLQGWRWVYYLHWLPTDHHGPGEILAKTDIISHIHTGTGTFGPAMLTSLLSRFKIIATNFGVDAIFMVKDEASAAATMVQVPEDNSRQGVVVSALAG